MESLIEFQDARIGYEEGTSLFSGINLRIEKGEHTFILGNCGTGKSAIVKTILGLLDIWGGTYYAFGRDMARPSAALLSYVRKKIGILPDRGILLQHMTVFENIALPYRYGHFQPIDKITRTIEPMMEEFLVGPIKDRYPSSLNLDEIKKCGYIRAIMNAPDLLILDDPVEGLDERGIEMLGNSLMKLGERGETTIVVFSRKSWKLPGLFGKKYEITSKEIRELS